MPLLRSIFPVVLLTVLVISIHWLGNRNGHDGDRIVLVGSYDLLYQCKEFIEKNIPGVAIRIKPEGKFWRLYVYSYTARMLAKLLYDNCLVALDRKLVKARQMTGGDNSASDSDSDSDLDSDDDNNEEEPPEDED
jgi:hypothetical protein